MEHRILPSEVAEELAALRARVAELEQALGDRQRAENSDDEAQAILDTLLTSAPVGFALHDRALRCVRINSVLARMNGLPIERQLGRTLAEILPELAQPAEAYMRWILETGQPIVNLEESGVTMASSERQHWLSSYYPIRNRAGDIFGVGVLVVNVSDRKHAEAALRQSEARYRTLVENLPIVLFLTDLSDIERLHYISPQIEALLGYTPSEWSSEPGFWRTRLHPDEAARVDLEQVNLQATLIPTPQEHRMLARDGRVVWVHDETVIVRDEAGRPLYMLGFTQDITARKEAEAARDHLAAIVAASNDSIVALTLDGIVASWNAGAERLYGFSSAEMVGQPIDRIVPVLQRAPLATMLDRIRAGEHFNQVATPRLRNDGAQIVVALTGFPIRDQSGAITHAAFIAHDITARKRAEDRQRFLAEAGAVLAASLDYETTLAQIVRLVVPHLADGCTVYLLDEHGRARMVKLLYVDPAQAQLARAIEQRYPVELDAPDGIGAVLRNGRPLLVPVVSAPMLRAIARDDAHAELLSQLTLHSYMVVPLLAVGQVIGALTFMIGAPTRRFDPDDLLAAEELARRAALASQHAQLYHNAQQAIRRQDEALALLDALLANTPIGLGFVDTQLRYVQVNEALAALNGIAAADHIGHTVRELLPGLASKIEPLFGHVLATGEPLLDIELRGENPAGPGYRHVWLVSYYPVQLIDNTPLGIGVAVIDITARKQAEAAQLALERKLLETQKLESLGVLAGGIAHDFNNLLVAILGNAELALMDLPLDSPACESIVQVQVASQRAAELTGQMLAYSGRGRFIVERVDLNALTVELATLLHASIPKRVTLLSRLDPRLPPIEVDATQVRQVLMNLVVNAAEAVGDFDGQVTITTAVRYLDLAYFASTVLPAECRAGTYVVLEVADTGVGMDATVIERIFEPFFTTKFTGRGLGMAAVLGIMRGHHGTIRIESQPGRGTTITAVFPIIPAGSASVQVAESAITPAFVAPPNATILVIDDEETVRAVAQRMLERLGFHVIQAASGRAGLAQYHAHTAAISLILLDLTMPDMSGEEVYRALRSLAPATPLVIMSGYSAQELSARFRDNPPSAFVQKPFTPATLAEALQELAGRPGALPA